MAQLIGQLLILVQSAPAKCWVTGLPFGATQSSSLGGGGAGKKGMGVQDSSPPQSSPLQKCRLPASTYGVRSLSPVLPLPFWSSSCVTLDKLLTFSMPQFSHLKVITEFNSYSCSENLLRQRHKARNPVPVT